MTKQEFDYLVQENNIPWMGNILNNSGYNDGFISANNYYARNGLVVFHVTPNGYGLCKQCTSESEIYDEVIRDYQNSLNDQIDNHKHI